MSTQAQPERSVSASFRDRLLSDGLYTVPQETVVVSVPVREGDALYLGKQSPTLEEFAAKYPDFVVASAYETCIYLLLSQKPERIKKPAILGAGFCGHGTTAFIQDCPPRLLILGEND